ncbi:MAG TPA: thiamine pyrophosphate-dependent dehydrogenase E1 component subunit alpha [Gemmatimonadaceae bacterium]|nr:thiamine pyrophosphate-dependent dehydrogenase E1 component subunit alpha [Gemmatimonadaceae bacterium]
MIRYRYEGEGVEGFLRRGPAYAREFHLRLFREMFRIRLIEEEIERRYHEDQMKTPIHLVIGQEATSVGCCASLTHDDLLYSSHRTHGNYLAKGGDLRAMLCEMFCRANGCVGSRGGSMHLIDKRVGMAGTSAIVAGAMPIATGAALAAKMKREARAVVVFFGEAATEEGASSESLNFATLKQLPVVFFCENNFYSVQSPLWTRQPPRELWRWAEGYGLPSVQVDGMNVLAVYEAARQAVERAKSGGGPTFIEAMCYRFRAHGGAGDDTRTGYREQAERDAWDALDPVALHLEYLVGAGLLSRTERDAMREEIVAEVMDAFEFATSSPNPVEADLFRHVYAD